MKMLKYLIGSILALPVVYAQQVLGNVAFDLVLVILISLLIFFLIKKILSSK